MTTCVLTQPPSPPGTLPPPPNKCASSAPLASPAMKFLNDTSSRDDHSLLKYNCQVQREQQCIAEAVCQPVSMRACMSLQQA
jgi:hypothetical protein